MRYAIWNKQDPVLTPIGEVLTAEQWIQRYPIAGVESITIVCAGGEINVSQSVELSYTDVNIANSNASRKYCHTLAFVEASNTFELAVCGATLLTVEI